MAVAKRKLQDREAVELWWKTCFGHLSEEQFQQLYEAIRNAPK